MPDNSNRVSRFFDNIQTGGEQKPHWKPDLSEDPEEKEKSPSAESSTEEDPSSEPNLNEGEICEGFLKDIIRKLSGTYKYERPENEPPSAYYLSDDTRGSGGGVPSKTLPKDLKDAILIASEYMRIDPEVEVYENSLRKGEKKVFWNVRVHFTRDLALYKGREEFTQEEFDQLLRHFKVFRGAQDAHGNFQRKGVITIIFDVPAPR